MSFICVRSYEVPEFNMKEIFRYAGARASEDILNLAESCISEIENKLTYKVCYGEFPVITGGNMVDLSFAQVKSASLRENLAGCGKVIVFAATVGLELDRAIAKYSRISPSKALMLQAIGAERIESLCNVFDGEMKAEALAEGLYTRRRFSPGYGDLPLDIQKDIFRVLDCSRKIGLSLNDSLMMSPSKSVTAFMGVSESSAEDCSKKCTGCKYINCNYRSE